MKRRTGSRTGRRAGRAVASALTVAAAGLVVLPTANGAEAPAAGKVTIGDKCLEVAGGDTGNGTAVKTGQRLHVADGKKGRAWGAQATLGPAHGKPSPAAQWYFQKVVKCPAKGGASQPTGKYRLVNRHSGLALSFEGKGSANPMTTPQGADQTQLLSFGS
ncbi:RICIN domain-containing protein [Streptomyces sp. NPDC002795]|uniref:RICIN domain-containing protein n=1 Tax=Streptomyces sp. NPDC002795 TaxID=3364665 RepID=UPI0036B619D2